MNIQDKIVERIRKICSLLNFTHKPLVSQSEIDRTFMNQVENGKRSISIATLEKIVCIDLNQHSEKFLITTILMAKGGQGND